MWTRNFTVQPRPFKFLLSFQWIFVCWCNENLDILHLFQPMTSQLWFFTFDWIKLECGRQTFPSRCHTMVHWKAIINLNGLGFRRIKDTWAFGKKWQFRSQCLFLWPSNELTTTKLGHKIGFLKLSGWKTIFYNAQSKLKQDQKFGMKQNSQAF